MQHKKKQKSDDDIVGLVPPTKSILAFLASTMLMLFCIGALNLIILDFYVDVEITGKLFYLFGSAIVFCGVNVAILRGSFFAVKIFKYYLSVLFVVFLPSVLLMEYKTHYIPFYFICMIAALLTFYLLNNKHYHFFVQYQFDAAEDLKEVQAAFKAEMSTKKRK
ncbi:hypothetical protein [Shewanella glacialimarina]|jgi:hypothetical protein|uniref:hypothetical protein n=1 Tax=Shewanella glacialimarina TaxID=2590884 RepID=UPI001CF8713B|nr:hypothetical protein [Shewanella glacialimarina]